jgi:hypothetical protein
MRGRTVLKIAIGALVIAGAFWLFLKSVRDTLAEPYFVDGSALADWTLVLDEPGPAGAAILALQPPGRMASEVFRQIFQRAMVSLTAPTPPAMPVVLRSEYVAALQSALPADELLVLAREAGLEQERFEPVCLASRQEAAAGRSRQLYFAMFDAAAFRRFREQLARLHEERGGSGRFDPAALPPVLPVASSDADFARWWPLEVDANRDCQAPLVVAGGESGSAPPLRPPDAAAW